MRQRSERLLVFIGDPACPVSILSIRNLTITVKPIHRMLQEIIIQAVPSQEFKKSLCHVTDML